MKVIVYVSQWFPFTDWVQWRGVKISFLAVFVPFQRKGLGGGMDKGIMRPTVFEVPSQI
jgi:hypothetical protein